MGTNKKLKAVIESYSKRLKNPSQKIEMAEVLDLLDKKQKNEILISALEKYFYSMKLKPYQAELIKMQNHLERQKMKMIILFDGRDASGKGGTIRRVTRYMNEKHYRVVALGKPSERQHSELHLKRYIEKFPKAGEVVLFDRSWYNRAMVEPVMGFCSKTDYKRFIDSVVSYEENFIADGKTILLKLYFSVGKDEQAIRFKRRKNDPLRQWKLSEVDLQAQSLWDEFTEKKLVLLKKTHSKKTPWWVIRSDDKHLARVETMKIILNSVRYRGRNSDLNFERNKDVVFSGIEEFNLMRSQIKKFGKSLR